MQFKGEDAERFAAIHRLLRKHQLQVMGTIFNSQAEVDKAYEQTAELMTRTIPSLQQFPLPVLVSVGGRLRVGPRPNEIAVCLCFLFGWVPRRFPEHLLVIQYACVRCYERVSYFYVKTKV